MNKIYKLCLIFCIIYSCQNILNKEEIVLSIENKSMPITRWFYFYDNNTFMYNMNSFDDNKITGNWKKIDDRTILLICSLNGIMCECGKIKIETRNPIKLEIINKCSENPFQKLNLQHFEFFYKINQEIFKEISLSPSSDSTHR